MIDVEEERPERARIRYFVELAEKRVARANDRILSACRERRSAIHRREELLERLAAWDKANPPAQIDIMELLA